MTYMTERLVNKYYDILKDGMASFDEEGLRSILAPDLDFEGPIAGHVSGAERFIKGVSGFAATMRGLCMLQKVWVGDEAAALYDAQMPDGVVRFAEFFQVAQGRIQSLRLLYDAGDYRASGGR